jgi:hypothetical protein
LFRSFLALGFKTILGGITGSLIFLGTGAVLGVLGGLLFEIILPFRPSNLIYIPFYVITGASNAFWFGGDFIFIPIIIGSGIAFLKNLHGDTLQFFGKSSGKIYWAALLCWVITSTLLITQKVNTINHINSVYSGFCISIKSEDYPSAYNYFSQEYRINTNLNQFIDDNEGTGSLYTTGCETKKFVSSIGKSASIFTQDPYYMATSFGSYFEGPELVLINVDGKWYFTGEADWYMD